MVWIHIKVLIYPFLRSKINILPKFFSFDTLYQHRKAKQEYWIAACRT